MFFFIYLYAKLSFVFHNVPFIHILAGKFAQRSNLSQTKIFDDPSEVYKLLTNDSITVDNIRLINEEVIEVTYKEEEAFAKVNPNTNVVIAAFTTCHARLKLYEVLEQLGDRVMYQDTGKCMILLRFC